MTRPLIKHVLLSPQPIRPVSFSSVVEIHKQIIENLHFLFLLGIVGFYSDIFSFYQVGFLIPVSDERILLINMFILLTRILGTTEAIIHVASLYPASGNLAALITFTTHRSRGSTCQYTLYKVRN